MGNCSFGVSTTFPYFESSSFLYSPPSVSMPKKPIIGGTSPYVSINIFFVWSSDFIPVPPRPIYRQRLILVAIVVILIYCYFYLLISIYILNFIFRIFLHSSSERSYQIFTFRCWSQCFPAWLQLHCTSPYFIYLTYDTSS